MDELEQTKPPTRARRRRNLRVSDANLAKAIAKAGGLLADAAAMCGISRATVSRRLAENPRLREAADEALEAALDEAESALMERIRRGDERAIEFFLEYKGRSRGYGVRHVESLSIRTSVASKFTRAELLDMAGAVEASSVTAAGAP